MKPTPADELLENMMAYDNYEDEEFLTTDETLESVRRTLLDLEDRIKKAAENEEESAAGIRNDIGQSRREMVHMRSSLQRLQARFDNQLTVLVLGNIASGVGVAAIVLAATEGFR